MHQIILQKVRLNETTGISLSFFTAIKKSLSKFYNLTFSIRYGKRNKLILNEISSLKFPQY